MDAGTDRRTSERASPAPAGWTPRAILRPGHAITLVNVAAGGVLIRTGARVLPGKRVDLQLLREGGKQAAGGRVVRCRVLGLGPLSYEAAIALEGKLTLGGERPSG